MKNLTLVSLLSFMLTLISSPTFAEEGIADFTSVAKKAIPAVLSVKVEFKKTMSKRSWDSLFDEQGQDDFFGNDFFSQFFNRGRRIQEENPTPVAGLGSGFIVSEDGYVLTNNHIVQDADKILVTLNNGREYEAKLVGGDPSTDVAVLKIETQGLPFLKLGDSSQLEVGQWVVAVGNPFGLQATLTVGVVSAVDRSNLGLNQVEDFIQTDAAINRGNSGGPLMNLKGEVIGMNTAIATQSGGHMGIGFAIPSNMASQIMHELIDHGSFNRGYMGVLLQQIDQDLAAAFNLDNLQGALISEVAKDSPADQAGLKRGDVILKYNNQPVKSISAIRNAISMMKPDETVRLIIKRGDKELSFDVKIAPHPANLLEQASAKNALGIDVKELTPELAKSLGYNDEKGVVISSVEPNSISALAGIKKGSLILSVNHQDITTTQEFLSAIKETPAGKPVLLLIRQGDMNHYVSLKGNF